MDNVKRGEIVDYDVPAENSASDPTYTGTLPMLVLSVNDQDNGDNTVTGLVFLLDGTTRVAHVREGSDAPEDSTPPDGITFSKGETVNDVRAALDKLTPAERALLVQAMAQEQGQGAPGADVPVNPATAPAATPATNVQENSAPAESQAQGDTTSSTPTTDGGNP